MPAFMPNAHLSCYYFSVLVYDVFLIHRSPRKHLLHRSPERHLPPKTELVKVPVPHRPQYSTECLDPEVQEWLAFDRLSSEQQTVAEIDSVDKKDNEQQDKRDDKGKLESSKDVKFILLPKLPPSNLGRSLSKSTNSSSTKTVRLVISPRPTAEGKHDYLMTSYRLPYFPQSFITQVRHLAIFPGELGSMTMIQGPGKRTVEDFFYSLLKPFSALETLYLIGHFERQDKAQLPFYP
ncbi:hypothetical protein DL95DRAFT_411216 [Leptodontidium sp. 2 PMI_412]|nr:hypothetical protein DL95DRAFT_411216 [Leptodontidium sp. 2 PMI_412]